MANSNSARICAIVCEQHAGDLPQAITRAAEVADMIELRLDCLPETELAQSRSEISAALAARERPIILTLRPAEFGGGRAINVQDRLFVRIHYRWLHLGNDQRTDFWDIELDLALLLQQRQKEGNDIVGWGLCDWTRSICSYHDFVGVSYDLEQIYESMAATESRVLKIAVQADDAIDCLPVFRLLARAQREGREMIAIAMGPAGIMTRILGPSRGAFLTYGSLDNERATAPGQLTARELREVYRIDRIDRHTEIFGLMGRPVSHSVSPHFQNAAFHAAGLNAVYIPFEMIDASAFIRRMVHPRSREIDWNLRGLSVTAPHKISVIPHLDWIDSAAKEIGAVNTIVVAEDALRGYNTDGEAFIVPLQGALGPLANVSCAIIGAGGAACAALSSLQRAGAQATLFARNPESVRPLAQRFGVDCRPLREASFEDFEVVVNATPLGTIGDHQNESPALAAQLRGVRLVYDLVYNPTETLLLQQAARAGCACLGGLEMLVLQAAAQFKLWTGVDAPLSVMREAATLALNGEEHTH